jgi:Polysaccharide lyase
VVDGDDYYGERCELGNNDKDAPNTLYREGQRRVTFASIRLPFGTDPNSDLWRTVLQMKQTEPYHNPQAAPMFELEVRSGQWAVENNWTDLWHAPAQQNVWTRWAFDVTYSSNASTGSVKAYVDLNNDGDFADPGEQSPIFHAATLLAETSGGSSPYAPGQSIPSHLRAGIYQDPAYSCPSGCSVDIDNVQVLAP